MKKTTAISIAIVTLIVIALVFTLIAKKVDAPASHTDQDQSSQAESDAKQEGTKQTSSGQYMDYGQVKLASSKTENYLFFHAPWCPQCRSIETSINEGGEIPENTTIYKVDYDSNQDLRKKYGVTLQTTFVKVDSQGNFIDKYVAYDQPTIRSVVENFINK